MIHSVRIGNQTIRLLPESVERDKTLGLFNADSMTLLVGPNGSGKTTLLENLAQMVLDEKSMDVIFEGDRSRLQVIYLTLSPFGRPNLAPGSDRLQVLYREKTGSPITPTLDFLGELDVTGEFGRPTRVELLFDRKVEDGLRLLNSHVASAFRSEELRGPKELTEKLGEVASLREAAEARRTDFKSNLLDWFESEAYLSVKNAQEEVDVLLRRIVVETLSNEADLLLRSFAITLAGGNNQAKSVRGLLPYFGVEVGSRPIQNKLQSDLEKNVARLRALGESLKDVTGDAFLRKNSYRFDISKLEQVKACNLGGLARLQMADMSSGMAALYSQFSLIAEASAKLQGEGEKKNSLLLLVDEGDVFLHMSWQQRYVKYMNNFVGRLQERFDCVQVVLATHSPVLMSDFPRDHIHKLTDGNAVQNASSDGLGNSLPQGGPIVSFGAPLESIVRSTGDAGTMGLFAAETIGQWIADRRDGGLVAPEKIGMIDDLVLRRLLQNMVPSRSP